MAIWDDVISERDKQVYTAAGYGARQELGQRPALLVVDVCYNFTGEKPEPILESIRRYRNSCGEAAWKGIDAIKKVLAAARTKGIPVFYSTPRRRDASLDLGRWTGKNRRAAEDTSPEGRRGMEIVREIAPRPGDVVIEKDKPSVFFGTPLASYLVELGVDTLIVTGTTTSGCVRATVVDGFSLNYRIAVVEEGTFDRGEVSHKVNLFDMNAKYADVMPLNEVLEYIHRLPAPVRTAG